MGGGDLLLRGSVAAARRLGVSQLMIGLVLIGLGTSAPELVTSVNAAIAGVPGLAVGNVIGSNIANVLLILGATALVAPIAVERGALRRDAGVMLVATGSVAAALLLLGGVGRGLGLAFIAGLAGYLAYAYRVERFAGADVNPGSAVGTGAPAAMGVPAALALAGAGLGMTLLGADWLVGGAIWLAGTLGMSDAMIGLTVVAIVTSLPELTACMIAAWRGHAGVALGNVLGSNIYNALLILGTTGAVAPFETPADIGVVDVGLMAGAALLVVPFALTGLRIQRWEGGVLLVAYVGYMLFTVV